MVDFWAMSKIFKGNSIADVIFAMMSQMLHASPEQRVVHLFFFVGLGFELRALCLQSRY
jgi:hypothetical protein